MDLARFAPPVLPPRVPTAAVTDALTDARAVVPVVVHRSVALAVAHGSEKTARLRLERLARAVLATDARVATPGEVWAADWSALEPEVAEALDRGIRATWSSVATRNAMRDAVRAVLRESLNAGLLTHDRATPLLNAVRPEKQVRDTEKQARGHLPASRVRAVFHALAHDESLTARRRSAWRVVGWE